MLATLLVEACRTVLMLATLLVEASLFLAQGLPVAIQDVPVGLCGALGFVPGLEAGLGTRGLDGRFLGQGEGFLVPLGHREAAGSFLLGERQTGPRFGDPHLAP